MSSDDVTDDNKIKASKEVKGKSKISRIFAACRKHLAWYFMLLFNNPYPIGKSSKSFNISALILVLMTLNVLFGISLLHHASCGLDLGIRLFAIAMAVFAAWMNFNSMLLEKIGIYHDKVGEASNHWKVPYEVAVVKMAAMYPGLELDRECYEAWHNALWTEGRFRIFYRCMLYPVETSSEFKDFFKKRLRPLHA